jgi:hypothetical protein
LNDRNSRKWEAILSVPSQSAIPAQPVSAYVLFGLVGMSFGFFADFL